MSSGGGGKVAAAARSRVVIPSSVKKTIDAIKEITGHKIGDDEIYAMLKDCSMDPNETTQKLLLLDAFHEVKKRRDKRRENSNKEPAQSKWKQASLTHVNIAGRRNYSPKPLSHDAGGERNSSTVKENGIGHTSKKVVSSATLDNTQNIRKNEASNVASTITDISNCACGITSKSTNTNKNNIVCASGSATNFTKTKTNSVSKLEEPPSFSSPFDSNENLGAPWPRDIKKTEMLDSGNSVTSLTSTSASGSQISSLDPSPFVSQDSALQTASNMNSCKMGRGHILLEQNTDNPSERNIVVTLLQKLNDFPGVGENHHLETLQTASLRPSSDQSIHSQVKIPQKANPGKEWKPKSTSPSSGQTASYEVSAISVGSHPESQEKSSEIALPDLQRKLEELHIYKTQQVVIPSHLQVPEAGKFRFCFGSFDASFGLEMIQDGSLGSDKNSLLFESIDPICEPVKVPQWRDETASVAGGSPEIKYPVHIISHSQGPEKFSSTGVEVLPSITHDHGESKLEKALQGHQHPVEHTSSSYNGHVLSMLNDQLPPSENSESQAHGAPQIPGFIMHQSFDPTNYHAQFYRGGMDIDDRISPLNSVGLGAVNKYNGNAGLISVQTSQSPREGEAPLLMSTASPVCLLPQAAGVMQSSISANQQHLPVFHQPTGIHLTHYPQFVPYAPYFSPFFVPPHAIHQFFSSGAFPQQTHSVNFYLNPDETPGKYSVSQNEQGSNIPSLTRVGIPGSHGAYNVPLANYSSISITESLSSALNEDVKENNMYTINEQTEGSGVCQGQLGSAPQPIAIPIDKMGPTAGVYPKQHGHLNWPNHN